MPTYKQKRALDNIVETGGNNIGKAMMDAGYSKATAHTPQKLTEAPGFLQLCEERGLTDDLLVDALVEDITEKKGNRKAELELGFKVKGRTGQEESKGDTNVQINVVNYYESDDTPSV